MEGLGIAVNVIAVVDLSAQIASICLQYSTDVKNARDDIARVIQEIDNLKVTADGALNLLKSPYGAILRTSHQLLGAVKRAESQLERLKAELRPRSTRKAMSRLGLRALKWPFQSKDVEKIVQEIARCTQTISTGLQIDQTSILLNLDHKNVLGKLPIAPNASFDSHAEEHNATCLPTTRVELLEQITKWINDSDAKSVLWLNGMAGTRKSTISRTIARSLAATNQLGASFFFKRGEADRNNISKFFSTIASQMVKALPTLASHIKETIDTDPAIFNKALREQFEKLLLEPMLEVQQEGYTGHSIAIVVDALDECDRDDDVKIIIHLLSRVKALNSPRIKVFLTSRPELPIRLGFNEVKGTYQDLILHEIPPPVIERDIQAFLEHELRKIRKSYNSLVSKEQQLPDSWPDQLQIQTLVNMAVPLFIFAATTCRFLDQRGFGGPDHQLRQVLDYQTKVQSSELDLVSKFEMTYRPALDQQLVNLSPREKDKAVEQFRHIVGTIIILSSPLSTTALGHLLGVDRSVIADRLDMLHSVLSIPKDSTSPVRLLHLSFRDFLLDTRQRDEKNPFWVDEKQTHRQLAVRCLDVMGCLRQDVCGLKAPGTLRSTIDCRRIDACLPPEVQYACIYWAHHTQQAGSEAELSDLVYSFLTRHFLHWLEALSLLGRASESLSVLHTLVPILQDRSNLMKFVDDATRFIRSNISITNLAPLQLYCSALAFTPQKSIVRRTFENDIPAWIVLRPEAETDWDHCLQKLEGHSREVNSVAFSHNSALIASASDDTTVRLWRTDTGDCVQELKGHSGYVNTVAFSHNSALIASASHDKTVRLWRTDTGDCVQELKGHSQSVKSVAFSHNSALIASASDDKTVRLWRNDTGDCVQELKGHSDWVKSVAFSHDSALIASASHDKTVRLWRTDTGDCVQELKGHSQSVKSVAFSHDSALIASASFDETVRLWRTDTGDCVQELKGHSHYVNTVAFSHDSALIASASHDETVRLWRTDTGDCVQELKGHSFWVSSVAFSHNSALIASASFDETVRLWRTDTGDCVQQTDIGTVAYRLSFKVGNSHIITDAGAITINQRSSEVVPTISRTQDWHSSPGRLCMSRDRCWITSDGQKMLWLPIDFRPRCWAIEGPLVAIGCRSGRVIILRLSERLFLGGMT
ncbi:Vegetative incompatibility protein HET-E-1-like protein 7 [Colletotrichum chlorophyti]|uniref:Vegetative incompatibility protein HET-E-1-like protein 7 n=1 Tax=Colletotrichum chlorophyti TaxID=708187 RepID=A0A1Q8RFZ8_9PEZI|nr:Vegetative incompatibility protein HET-E-1-like protein 7 [Colletotrichum chlorophyti]